MSNSERPPIEPVSDVTWARLEQRVWKSLDTEPASVVEPVRDRRWWVAAPLAVAAAAAIVAVVVLGRTPRHEAHERPTRVVSATSSSSISFGDAHITLDAQTAIVMDSHDDAPTVLIEHGAAWFAVEPRGSRPPFVVLAGDTRVRVIGTRFRVARDAERVEVTVDHGTVEIGYHGDLARITNGEHWSNVPQTAEARPVEKLPPTVTPGPPSVVVPPAARPTPTPTTDRDAARFAELTRLEAAAPEQAMTGYLELSRGAGRWAPIALYAAVRLASDRGDPRARTLLEIYLRRFPTGANADDARQLLAHLKGDHR
ncbi:hypothetical protein BH11MYX1_BH11MYX1_53160 [soil metagenome]